MRSRLVRMTGVWCLLCAAGTVFGAARWRVDVFGGTYGRIYCDGSPVARILPGLHETPWLRADFGIPTGSGADGVLRGRVFTGGGFRSYDSALRAEQDGRTIRLHYELKASQAATLDSFHVSFLFPVEEVLLQPWTSGGKTGVTPEVYSLAAKRLLESGEPVFTTGTRHGALRFSVSGGHRFLWQDNRNWKDRVNVGLRVCSPLPPKGVWPAGQSHAMTISVTFPDDVTLQTQAPFRISRGADWYPLTLSGPVEAGSALDFSAIVPRHRPAGKFGRLNVVGNRFEFEGLPGVAQRFSGSNLVGNANTPPAEKTEEAADAISRMGYNAIRYHHYAGAVYDHKNLTDSTQLHPERLDRFDRFFAALKARGIYGTTDCFSSRGVLKSEFWPGETGRMAFWDFKALLYVDPRAFENWKAFVRRFFTHRNPYTGMTYAEDPAMLTVCLVNEGNPEHLSQRNDPRVLSQWRAAWSAWVQKRYGDAAKRDAAWKRAAGESPELPVLIRRTATPAEWEDYNEFLHELETAIVGKMRAFMTDEIGCRLPLTNRNHSGFNPQACLNRLDLDFVDQHFYIDHPQFFGGRRWQLPAKLRNHNVLADGCRIGGMGLMFTRHLDRPFTVTETNYSYPGQYRGVGGILTGCLGALQNWDGIWRFAYAHGERAMFRPAAAGYFDTVRDPLNQAAERALACLYLRGDLKPLTRTVALAMPDTLSALRGTEPNSLSSYLSQLDWQVLGCIARIGVTAGAPGAAVPADVSVPLCAGAPKAPIETSSRATDASCRSELLALCRRNGWISEKNATSFGKTMQAIRLETPGGELRLDSGAGTMVIDTPRTAGAFGPPGTQAETSALRSEIAGSEATVWATSLSDVPLQESPRILVTHLTDLQNDGIVFADDTRTIQLEWGGLPHIVRAGTARLTLRRAPSAPKLKGYVLDVSGRRVREWPLTPVSGGYQAVCDASGPDGARLYYELTAE